MKCLSCYQPAFLLFVAMANAQEKNAAQNRWRPPQGVPELSIGYLLGVLLLFAVAIIAVVWLAKKWTNCRFAGTRHLVLKESLYLGNKTFLHAVEIDGRLVVVGVGPHPIQIVSESVSEATESIPSFTQTLTAAVAAPPAVTCEEVHDESHGGS